METRGKHPQRAEVSRTGAGAPVLRDLYALSGRQMLNRILNLEDPRTFIQGLSSEDFYWLIKKIGEGDCVPFLELASTDQWQYLLDLEIWKGDRLDITDTSQWLSLLQQADCRQLVRWLFRKGEDLAYYHLLKTLEVVVISDKDDVYDLSGDFYSLDGVFYIRVLAPENRESLEEILRVMAKEDYGKYEALLLGLAGVIPAELEEEMYRLRNIRLAEHGFLPREEAIGVYAPLDPDLLRKGASPTASTILDEEETLSLVPILPMTQTGTENLFMEVAAGIGDPLFLERLRLEFAGLANQILSADGTMVHEPEVLTAACKKAARVVNLSLEKACGRDPASAEELLKRHSLVTLFRVGFGMALKLKWEAERWLKESWFHGQELDPDFWGTYRGGILKGLLAKSPLRYVGSTEKEPYRDFEWPSDITECLEVLRGVMVLDGLLQRLVQTYPLKEGDLYAPEATFHTLLFNLWACLLLKMPPAFSGISLERAKDFLTLLRGKGEKPPYDMAGYERTFIGDLTAHVKDSQPEMMSLLEDVLSGVWEEFREEYAHVPLEDIDGRYSRFLTIRHSG